MSAPARATTPFSRCWATSRLATILRRTPSRFAWDLLVNKLGLPVERLWFTVYQDDDEAERLWIETGADPSRVLRFGKKDNWWAMGDTGPCGPCSEIHYYWGDLAKQVKDGVNKDDEYLEIWNLVFMQYDAKPNGELVPLPAPSVDTGAGLERLASILQGKDNNYDTDAFTPIMARIQQLAGADRRRAPGEPLSATAPLPTMPARAPS